MASGRPCGACRFLRKRCLENCLFTPHFSADKTGVDKFRSIHKVFGHSNFAKLLQQLPVEQRHGAVASMLFEAQARLRDPVHGCISIISALQKENESLKGQNESSKWQNENLKEQLALTRAQLAEFWGLYEGLKGQNESLQRQNESFKEQLALTRAQLAECWSLVEGLNGQNESLKEQLARTRPQIAECLAEGSRNIQIADYTNDNQSRPPYSMTGAYQTIVQQNQQYSVWEEHQSAMPQNVAVNQYAVQPVPPPAEGPSCLHSYMHREGVSNLISNASSMEQRDPGIDLGDFHSSQDVSNRLSRASRTL